MSRSTTHQGYYRRRIPRYSSARSIYRFRSRKNQQSHRCESRLEFEHCLYLEWSPHVECYQTQPPQLAFHHGTRIRRYTPDVLLQTSNRELIYREVKTRRALRDEKVIEKLLAFRASCFARGIGFEIVTDDQIRRPPLRILCTLYRYAHLEPKAAQLEGLLSLFEARKAITVAQAFAACDNLQIPRTVVPWAMFHGYLAWPQEDQFHSALPLILPTQEVSRNVKHS
ncbi:MAG: TnsA endonuclease N-terminal domain-containing protein [Rhodothermales bacterium]